MGNGTCYLHEVFSYAALLIYGIYPSPRQYRQKDACKLLRLVPICIRRRHICRAVSEAIPGRTKNIHILFMCFGIKFVQKQHKHQTVVGGTAYIYMYVCGRCYSEYVVPATSSAEKYNVYVPSCEWHNWYPTASACIAITRYINVPSRHKYRQIYEIRIYEAVVLDLWRRFQFLLLTFIQFKIGK